MRSSDSRRNSNDVLRAVALRPALFALTGAIFATVAMPLCTHFIPLRYTATTVFERRSDNQEDAARAGGDTFGVLKLTLQHELSGYSAVERAAKEAGLDRDLPRELDNQLTRQGKSQWQAIVEGLRRQVAVKFDVRSEQVDLISVSFTHSDPEVAEKMANILVRNYITHTSEQIVTRLRGRSEFLGAQVAEGADRLDALVRDRIRFEEAHAGMQLDSPRAIEEQIETVSTDLETVRRQLKVSAQKLVRLNALGGGAADASPTTQPAKSRRVTNPEYIRLAEELRLANTQLDTAMTVSHMTERHPTVVGMRERITQLQKRLESTPRQAGPEEMLNVQPGDLPIQIAAAQSEAEIMTFESERLERRLASLRATKADFASARQRYLKLVKNHGEAEDEVRRWQAARTEVEMALAGELANRRTQLSQLEQAKQQHRPSFPQLWMILGGALGGGLIFGGTVAVAAQAANRTVASARMAEMFDVPIRGVIEEVLTPAGQARRRMLRNVVWPAVGAVVLAALAASVLNVVLWLHYPDLHRQLQSASMSLFAVVARLTLGGVGVLF